MPLKDIANENFCLQDRGKGIKRTFPTQQQPAFRPLPQKPPYRRAESFTIFEDPVQDEPVASPQVHRDPAWCFCRNRGESFCRCHISKLAFQKTETRRKGSFTIFEDAVPDAPKQEITSAHVQVDSEESLPPAEDFIGGKQNRAPQVFTHTDPDGLGLAGTLSGIYSEQCISAMRDDRRWTYSDIRFGDEPEFHADVPETFGSTQSSALDLAEFGSDSTGGLILVDKRQLMPLEVPDLDLTDIGMDDADDAMES
jgi:hypothetical protein